MQRYVYLALLFALAVAATFIVNKTGFVVNTTYVSIAERTEGKVTILVYNSSVMMGDVQNIYMEFMNTGTKNFTGTVGIKLYLYKNGRLNPLSEYLDVPYLLSPGRRRPFRTSYYPPENGTYYIRARAAYSTRVAETWGSFVVVPFSEQNQTAESGWETQGTNGTGGGGAVAVTITVGGGMVETTVIKEASQASMLLSYPREIVLHKNESYLASITVNNTGSIDLPDIKLHISGPSAISIGISPKQIFFLPPNETSSFLVSFYVPDTASEGEYRLVFDMASAYMRESGEILLKVVPWGITKEEVEDIVLNYGLLISDLWQKTASAEMKGFYVGEVKDAISRAEGNMSIAKG